MKKNISMIFMLSILELHIYAMRVEPEQDLSTVSADSSQSNVSAQKQKALKAQVAQAQKALSDAQNTTQREANNNVGSSNSLDIPTSISLKSKILDSQDQLLQSQKSSLASRKQKSTITARQQEIEFTQQQINQLSTVIKQNNNKINNLTQDINRDRSSNNTPRTQSIQQLKAMVLENQKKTEELDAKITTLIDQNNQLITSQDNRINPIGQKTLFDSAVNRINETISSLKVSPKTALKVKTSVSSIFNTILYGTNGTKSSGNKTADNQEASMTNIKQNLNEIVTALNTTDAKNLLSHIEIELQRIKPTDSSSSTGSFHSGSSSSGPSLFNPYVDASSGPIPIPITASQEATGQILDTAFDAGPAIVGGIGYLISGTLQVIGAILQGVLSGGM